jgi:hypothetical protein
VRECTYSALADELACLEFHTFNRCCWQRRPRDTVAQALILLVKQICLKVRYVFWELYAKEGKVVERKLQIKTSVQESLLTRRRCEAVRVELS